MTTHLENLLRVAETKGLIRARDLADHGIPRQYLSIACELCRHLLDRIRAEEVRNISLNRVIRQNKDDSLVT